MQIIPFMVDEGHFNIFVVLEDENLRRMKAYDPAQFALDKLPGEWRSRKLNVVIIGYATPADLAHVKHLADAGVPDAVLVFLSRGFAFRPDLGDSDKPYESRK